MRSLSLKVKVGSYLALALAVAMVVFTGLVVRHQHQELLDQTREHLSQVSEIITRSTRYAMLENRPEFVARIIQDVARQDNIVKVRIVGKDGTITHSSLPQEVGRTVDRNADGCVICHQGERPLEQVPRTDRVRVYRDASGKSLLGSMEVIRNDASCSSTACHVHDAAQSVLGVLDIVYSLEDTNKTLRINSAVMAIFSLNFIIIAAFLVSLLVSRLVYRPLADLAEGADRLAAGDIAHVIPVRSGDEFGHVAGSFNTMMLTLKKNQTELQQWAHTLEEKISERTQQLQLAEAEKVRSEKLASVGLLAAGIAHELNNPLTGVLTFSHLVRQKMAEGSEEAEDLDLVIRETKRCAGIIKRLLDFAREKPPEKKFSDVNKIVENTKQLLDTSASLGGVDIVMQLDAQLPAVWADADLIEQVLLNILVNAQHAISGEGGRIIVTTRQLPESTRAAPAAGPLVEIAISDNGCGIPAENLPRIFDPFFTSKEVGKGTGLGLSVSHGIVAAHGGRIEVQSTEGVGTTFRILLPVLPPAASANSSQGRESS